MKVRNIYYLSHLYSSYHYLQVLCALLIAALVRMTVSFIIAFKMATQSILTGSMLHVLVLCNIMIFHFFIVLEFIMSREKASKWLLIWLISGLPTFISPSSYTIYNLLYALSGFPIVVWNLILNYTTAMEISGVSCKVFTFAFLNLILEMPLLFTVIVTILKGVLPAAHYKRGDQRLWRTLPFLFIWTVFFIEIMVVTLLPLFFEIKSHFTPEEVKCGTDEVSCINWPFKMNNTTNVGFVESFVGSCTEWPFFTTIFKIIMTAELFHVSVKYEIHSN